MNKKIDVEGHKLMYHPGEVSKWLNEEMVAPIYVEIGPINSCNHKCIFCALDYLKSKGKMIDKTVLIDTLRNMAEFGVKSVMFAGEGEPLAYPYISEAVESAYKFGLDVAITTNGVLFTVDKIKSMLKHLSWIKFSIDAGTKWTYAGVHGCTEEDFEKVFDNIKAAVNYRKENRIKCAIGCQILLISDNVNEVERLIIKVKNVGADYLVLKPYSQHPHSVNKMILDLKRYDDVLSDLSKKYSDDGFKVIYRNLSAREIEQEEISYKICYGLNFFTLIDALGNIIPCNIFYEKPEFYYGNVNKNTFEEIWSGVKRKKVIEKLYSLGCSDCRKGCRLNFVNKYLDAVKNRDIEHINFI